MHDSRNFLRGGNIMDRNIRGRYFNKLECQLHSAANEVTMLRVSPLNYFRRCNHYGSQLPRCYFVRFLTWHLRD